MYFFTLHLKKIARIKLPIKIEVVRAGMKKKAKKKRFQHFQDDLQPLHTNG